MEISIITVGVFCNLKVCFKYIWDSLKKVENQEYVSIFTKIKIKLPKLFMQDHKIEIKRTDKV